MEKVYPSHWKKAPFIESPTVRWGIYLGALAYLVVAIYTVDINIQRIVEGGVRAMSFMLAFFTPDFISRWDDIYEGFVESLAITGASTVIGVLISIPIGLGAARNISPLPIYLVCRSIVSVSRAFQDVIIAVFFVAIFGFGAFAGVMTLIFTTVGFIAKLLAEDIEAMHPEPLEAIRSTGASWTQLMNYAVQPQVVPRLVGLSMYRLDINFRESSVIGLVGAGGIGATLNTAFDRYEFDSASAILIIIIVIVLFAEYMSGYIRGKLV